MFVLVFAVFVLVFVVFVLVFDNSCLLCFSNSLVLSSKQGIFWALGRFERTRVYCPAAVDVLQILAQLQLPTTKSTWGAF